MIRKILFAGIFLCLCIAVPLSILGFDHVSLGQPFMILLKNTSRELNGFKIAIPDIPAIPQISNTSASGDNIITWLIALVNALVDFINIITRIINVILMILNTVISLIQFIVILIKNLVTFKDSLQNTPLPVV